MSAKRSFESINYMLRPNKNVERKLIASTLIKLSPQFPIRDYRYVGLGSMWFADFVLMHKMIGITDLVSIEKQVSRSKRVEFNKPYACISVKMGDAASELQKLDNDKQSVIWLDYDGPLKSATSGDLEIAVDCMTSGSLILVSVNALVEQLRGNKLDDDELTPTQYLQAITGIQATPASDSRLTRNDFPELVAEILHQRLQAAVLASKPGYVYRPIWTFEYADDAVMVTVGGMIVDGVDAARLDECGLDQLAFLSAQKPFEISLPILTEKEKRELDRLLPSAAAIDVTGLPFELRQAEVDAYRRFYLEYPLFNELAA